MSAPTSSAPPRSSLLHHAAILGWTRTAVLALARLLQQRVAGRLKLH